MPGRRRPARGTRAARGPGPGRRARKPCSAAWSSISPARTADLTTARKTSKRHPGEWWCGDLAAVELARLATRRGDAVTAQHLLDCVDCVDHVDRPAPTLPAVSASSVSMVASSTRCETRWLGIGELTARETEVLDLLRTRLSPHDIAHLLFISPNTLRSHLRGDLPEARRQRSGRRRTDPDGCEAPRRGGPLRTRTAALTREPWPDETRRFPLPR